MVYDMPSNSYNIIDVFTYINNIFGGQFALMLILFIFVVFYVAIASFDSKKAVTGALFVTSMISGLFFLMGMVSFSIVVAIIGLTGMSLFLIKD